MCPPLLIDAQTLTLWDSPITMLRLPNLEKVPLRQRVLTKILALLVSVSMLAWGIPSAHAECASGCCCESGNRGTHSGVHAQLRGASPHCCSGSGDDPCETALDQSLPPQEYALAAESLEETPLPVSSAPGAAMVSLADHCPPRAAGPWKAPPATPGPPLYLSYLSLLI